MTMSREEGRFIVIEGGEGAGKSTAQKYLLDLLESCGVEVVLTREPGGTELAEMIRTALLSKQVEAPVPMAELLLVFAARAQHLELVIEPALSRGAWVLCDRFTDATYAYQGFARGMSLSDIAALENMVQRGRHPDHVIVMDLPPELGLMRAANRGALDRFESEESAFYARVREGYLARAHAAPERYAVVDASQSLEQVQCMLAGIVGQWQVT